MSQILGMTQYSYYFKILNTWFKIGNVTGFRGTHLLENGMHLNENYTKPKCLGYII